MNTTSTPEQMIIAYIEGALDRSSKETLLNKLTVSPEDRRMLDAHVRLSKMLTAAHTPFSAPLSVQQKLAEKLPFLAAELPHLRKVLPVPFTEDQSALEHAVNSRPGSSAKSLLLLGAVAFLMAGIALDFVAGSDESHLNQAMKLDPQSLQKLTSSAQPLSSSFNASRSSDESRHASATKPYSFDEMAPSITNAFGSRTAAFRYFRENKTSLTIASNAFGSGSDARSESRSQESAGILDSPIQSVSGWRPTAHLPMPENRDMPLKSFGIEDLTIAKESRWSAHEDTRVVISFLRGINNAMGRANGSMGETFGIAYQLDPNIRIGMDVGQRPFATLGYVVNYQKSLTTGVPDSYTSQPSINVIRGYWAGFSGAYSLSPLGNTQFMLSAGAGLGFLQSASPTIDCGARIEQSLSDVLALNLGVSFGGAWVRAQSPPDPQVLGTGGVIQYQSSNSWLFTPVLDFQIGVRYHAF